MRSSGYSCPVVALLVSYAPTTRGLGRSAVCVTLLWTAGPGILVLDPSLVGRQVWRFRFGALARLSFPLARTARQPALCGLHFWCFRKRKEEPGLLFCRSEVIPWWCFWAGCTEENVFVYRFILSTAKIQGSVYRVICSVPSHESIFHLMFCSIPRLD